MSKPKFREAFDDARSEARCMELDLTDAIATKSLKDASSHLHEAILRHAHIGRLLREALTDVSHRSCVLSMTYPANLGGGHGPDRA